MSVREVAALVARLPADARAKLHGGPGVDRCRVCQILTDYGLSNAAQILHHWLWSTSCGTDEHRERAEAICFAAGWHGD